MAEGRTQTMMEIWPIERHLNEFIMKNEIEAQAIFIAPTIYADSQRQIKFVFVDTGLTIRPYAIQEFIEYLNAQKTLYTNGL